MTTHRTSRVLLVCFSIYMLAFTGFRLFGSKIDSNTKLALDVVNIGIVSLFVVGISRSNIRALANRFREEDASVTGSAVIHRRVEDRLDELERLKRRDLVTPEEYAAKRQDILKDL